MAHQSTPTHRFVGTLQTRQNSNAHAIPAIISLQRYNSHKATAVDEAGYTCTLCWRNFEKPCYTVSSDSRIVCLGCWRWMYDLSICWACGEIVFRKEDAVRFGWCWWHWGCFSCLLCSAPLIPPSYLDVSGKPHTGGIHLHEPPLCNRCIDLPDAVLKLEQHVGVMNLPTADGVTSKPVDWTTPRVSIFKPLQMEPQPVNEDLPKPLDVVRQKPSWMSLLPSNRNPHLHPPRHSALDRRSSFPYFSSTRFSSPFSTPTEIPATENLNGEALPISTCLDLPKGLPTALSRRCPGEWPSSSQSSSPSEPGSEVTVEGAVVPNDWISDQHTSALTEPEVSMENAVLGEKVVPNTEKPEQNQTRSSSSISSLVSSTAMTPIKRGQPHLEDLLRPSRPAKLRKPSMANCIPEVPDAARHRPAYFKELSSFIATRDEKLLLSGRALDCRQNHDNDLEHKQCGYKSPPTRTENSNDTFNSKVNVQKSLVNQSSERLNVLAGKMMAMVSAGSDERGLGMLCKACRECPCRTGPTNGLRKRLLKASR